MMSVTKPWDGVAENNSERVPLPTTNASSGDAIPVRTAVRFPLQLEFVLKTAEREYKAVTEDVSANGVLFTCEELPPLETRVEFRLRMPADVMGGKEDVVLYCVGRVIRHTQVEGKAMAAAVIDEYSLKAESYGKR
jgi:hypothetical protein